MLAIGVGATAAYILASAQAPGPGTTVTPPVSTTTTTAPQTPNTPVIVTTPSGVTVPTGITTPTPGSGQSVGQAGQYTTPTTAPGSTVTTIGPFTTIGDARAYAAANLTVAGSVTQGTDGLYYIVYPGGPGGTQAPPTQQQSTPPQLTLTNTLKRLVPYCTHGGKVDVDSNGHPLPADIDACHARGGKIEYRVVGG
jgi:hypothetical protein